MTDLLAPPAAESPPESPPTGPAEERTRPPEPRRLSRFRPREFGWSDAGLVAASLLASFSVVWLLFAKLTLLSGPFGFAVCWLVTFLFVYWLVNLQLHDRLVATDRLVAAIVVCAGLAMLTPLVLITAYLVVKGWHLLTWHALTHSEKGVPQFCPPGEHCPTPGVAHAIVGTLEQAGIAALIGVPIGILTAVYISEVGGRFSRMVRVVVTAMSGVPSIVAGIFIYSLWIVGFGQGFSGFAGALALSVMLLPSVTRGTEEVLKVVSNDLREASQALGSNEWRTVWSVVLPTARTGIVTACLLGVARVVGETAPLLVTIFGNTLVNSNPFNGGQEALPLLAYAQVKLPLASAVALGFTAALTLYIVVFILFIAARLLSGVRWRGGLRFRRRSDSEKALDAAAIEGVRGGGQYL